jgi:uncharacterized protein
MSRVDGSCAANSQVSGQFDGGHGSPADPVDRARPASARAIVSLVRAYQLARSGRPTGCRYLPSCSEYALEAVDRHGPGRGTWLAVRRIARCGPWGGHGIDPVPERSTP